MREYFQRLRLHRRSKSHTRADSPEPVTVAPGDGALATTANKNDLTSSITNSALQSAIEKLTEKLSEQEKFAFRNAGHSLTENDLLQKVRACDEAHSESSFYRQHASKLEGVFNVLDKYMKVVSPAASAGTGAMIAVGAVRIVLHVALGFLTFFGKLSDMLCQFGDFLAPISEYAKFSKEQDVLQKALVAIYGDLLLFCQKAYAVFVDKTGRKRTMTAFRVFWRVQWIPFETEFGAISNNMRHHLQVLKHSSSAVGVRTILEIKSHQTSHEKEELLNWLSDFPYEQRHTDRYSQKHPGTGDWLIRHQRFDQWFNSAQSTLLWCYGGPGIGKSFLAANVLEHITAQRVLQGTCGIAFIYYDHQVAARQDLPHVIQALLKQMCRDSEVVPEGLLQAKHRSLPAGTDQHFLTVAETFDELFLVIDALDECLPQNRPDMIRFLRMVTQKSPKARVFVTSRPEIDIIEGFREDGTPTLKIEASSVSPDIEKYVNDEVRDLRRGRNGVKLHVQSDEVAAQIVRTLTDDAAGMFLWVRLQLQNLCKVSLIKRDSVVRKALLDLPVGLDATYSRILQQIEEQSTELRLLAIRCLRCVFYAHRPLESIELQYALARLDDDRNVKPTQLDPLDVLLGVCANLIVEEYHSRTRFNILRPAHYSIQEYFTSQTRMPSGSDMAFHLVDSGASHDALAATCLAHLYQPMMRYGEWMPWSGCCLLRDPFLQYAACFFDKHIIQAAKSVPVQHQTTRFLEQDPAMLGTVVHLRDMDLASWRISYSGFYPPNDCPAKSIWDMTKPGKISSAFIVDATLLGEIAGVQEQYASSKGSLQALHYACRTNSESAVLRMLARNVDVNGRDTHGRTAIWLAAQMGHEKLVRMLIEHGADTTSRDDKGVSALENLVYANTDLATMRLLLDREPSLRMEEQGLVLNHALQCAATKGRADLIQLLIERGADINAAGTAYGTPLVAATMSGHGTQTKSTTIRLLLDKGACIDASAHQTFGNALQEACGAGDLSSAQLLLDRGADVNARTGGSDSALGRASRGHNLELLTLLLDRGASINMRVDGHHSVLHTALIYGSLNDVELLLERGADVHFHKADKTSALQESLHRGDDAYKRLLQFGAPLDVFALKTAAYLARSVVVDVFLAFNGGSIFTIDDLKAARQTAMNSKYKIFRDLRIVNIVRSLEWRLKVLQTEEQDALGTKGCEEDLLNASWQPRLDRIYGIVR